MEQEYEGIGPLRYTDGAQPRAGDIVDVKGFCKGVVVAVFETSDFLDEEYRSFSYLGGGIMLMDEDLGLMAILDDKKEVRLLARPE